MSRRSVAPNNKPMSHNRLMRLIRTMRKAEREMWRRLDAYWMEKYGKA